MIIQEDFKRRVRERLTELAWSQSDLAREMGKSRQHVSDYLNGRKSAGSEVIEEFYGALGLRVHLSDESIPKWKPQLVTAAS